MPSWWDGLRLLMRSAAENKAQVCVNTPDYIKGQFIPGPGHLVTNFFASLVSCNNRHTADMSIRINFAAVVCCAIQPLQP